MSDQDTTMYPSRGRPSDDKEQAPDTLNKAFFETLDRNARRANRIVQIAHAPETIVDPDRLFALTLNGEVWCGSLNAEAFEWHKLPPIPEEEG